MIEFISIQPRGRHDRVVLSLWHGDMLVTGRPTWQQITQEVADRHRTTLSELVGYTYRRRLGPARREAWSIIYAVGRLSYPQIGQRFGGRDHSTILTGVRRRRQAAVEPEAA